MILLDYFKTALKPSVLKLLVKVFVTALFPIKKQTLKIQRNIFELKNKAHTFKKREKDKYHEVPAVLLYSFHLAPQRENESCIDETSGGTQATLPASSVATEKHLSYWGALHDSPLFTPSTQRSTLSPGLGLDGKLVT